MHTPVIDSCMTALQDSQRDLAGRSPRAKSPYRTLRIATESQEARPEPGSGMLQLLGHRFGQDYMAGLSTPSTQHQVGPLPQHLVQDTDSKAAQVPLSGPTFFELLKPGSPFWLQFSPLQRDPVHACSSLHCISLLYRIPEGASHPCAPSLIVAAVSAARGASRPEAWSAPLLAFALLHRV